MFSRSPRVQALGLAIAYAALANVLSAANTTVRWSAKLNLSSLADIDARLAQPEPMLAPDTPLRLSVGDTSRDVTNCLQYFAAQADGLRANTSFAMAQEGQFIGDCFALRDLKNAKPAVISFVPQKWTADALSILPPLLQWGDQNGVINVERPWSTVAGVRMTDYRDESVSVEDELSGYIVTTRAWGDFNGDGFEDIAVSVAARAKEGTLLVYAYYTLTRCNATGVLRAISSPMERWRPVDTRCP